MKVIIPMAGRGKRLRPYTLTIPKPLLKIAGKSIIDWIIDEIKDSTNKEIEEIHFIIGDFGDEVEKMLISTAKDFGAQGFIHYQNEPLGTAHALYCAKNALDGEVFIVFADTIFKGKIYIDESTDGVIWTMNVDEPEKYGVVTTDENNIINGFIEKPKDKVSSNAIVGLYYFKDARYLKMELEYLILNNLKENNEFQLTNCLEALKQKGNRLKCAKLDEWLDCGNINELLNTNNRIIEILEVDYISGENVRINSSKLINRCFIGNNVEIENSIIDNCIVYDGAQIKNSKIKNSIIGANTIVRNLSGTFYIGDYSECIYE